MKKRILFVYYQLDLGGGLYVLLQHALYLKKMGNDVIIALAFMTKEQIRTTCNSPACWHPALQELEFLPLSEAQKFSFDIAIFGTWAVLFSIKLIRASSYLFFVQSIESLFRPAYDTFLSNLIKKTYQLDLPIITEATWIKNFLEENYHRKVLLVKNGIRKDLFTINGPKFSERLDNKLRILIEGPLEYSYKNVAKAIQLSKQANAGEIWLLTSTPITQYPGINRVFSRIPIQDVPAIYRSCDVLVKLSYVEGMFAPPLEMFHCGGTAVVYDVAGYDEYIVHNENALVANTDDENAVISYLQQLNEDRELLHKLKQGAKKTAQEWIDWDTSSKQFANAVDQLAIPLTKSKIIELQHDMQEYLRQYVGIVLLKSDGLINMQCEAYPLYHPSCDMGGHYSLSIPLDEHGMQIGIAFGLNYEKVLIRKAEIEGSDLECVKLNLMLSKIALQEGNILNCESESGMLIANYSNNNPFKNGQFYLRIDFRPITARIH